MAPSQQRFSAARDLFMHMLQESLTSGTIWFRTGTGEFVAGPRHDTSIVVRVLRDRFFSQAICYGNLGLGEAFMNGDFEMENGALHELITVLLRNRLNRKLGKNPRILLRIAAYRMANAISGKQKNVQRHYDIGFDLFESFLDSRLMYSCGYAANADDSLEQLQDNKLDRICRKLRLKPGDHVLDIGCGFGGFLLFAATRYGVTGTGITISRDHCERGNAMLLRHGVSDRVRIEFRDHRAMEGQYDKVVSIGMLEHVPRSEYRHYFKKIARVLKPDALGLVHAVGCNGPRNEHDPFIQKYIFPASNQPQLSEIASFLEANELAILDVENIIRHYHPTALAWLRRFQKSRQTLDVSRYPANFQRMWEYYLSCAIAAALASDAAVYQVLFAKDYTTHMPLARV